MAEVINYEGKFAVEIHNWMNSWEKPEQVRWIEVSTLSFENHAHLEGLRVEFTGDRGVCYYNSRPITMDCGNPKVWHRELLTRPVRKPRCGRDYDYNWRNGRWERYWV